MRYSKLVELPTEELKRMRLEILQTIAGGNGEINDRRNQRSLIDRITRALYEQTGDVRYAQFRKYT